MDATKIRVLRIIARMNIGGPAIQVTNLMKELPEADFDQLLITGFCEDNEKDYLEENRIHIPVKRIKTLGRSINPFSDLLSLLFILRTIFEYRPHIIHTHTFKAGVLGRIAALISFQRIKTVHTFHGHLLQGYYGSLGTRTIVFIERMLAKHTTSLVAVGRKVREELVSHGIGNLNRFQVISPGFRIENVPNLSRIDLGLTDNQFVCAWVGRFTKIKRPERLLEIANLSLQDSTKDIKFIVVGDGDSRGEIETKSMLMHLPVVFLGWRVDVHAIIKLCDLVLCTSDNEGTPLSLIEAQMLGKPVISTDVGSVKEVMVVERSGFAIDYDPVIFLEKIMELKNSPSMYQEFAQTAETFAVNKFSLQSFRTKYETLYKDLLRV